MPLIFADVIFITRFSFYILFFSSADIRVVSGSSLLFPADAADFRRCYFYYTILFLHFILLFCGHPRNQRELVLFPAEFADKYF
jgi:hypothetical protein